MITKQGIICSKTAFFSNAYRQNIICRQLLASYVATVNQIGNKYIGLNDFMSLIKLTQYHLQHHTHPFFFRLPFSDLNVSLALLPHLHLLLPHPRHLHCPNPLVVAQLDN